MCELNLDESIEGIVCVFGWVAESLQDDVDNALDLGVADDFTKSLQASVG